MKAVLVLEDGSVWKGYGFGAKGKATGEVVFNTGMVGYPEAITDPSYQGQILCQTYPLIGNYGIPSPDLVKGIEQNFESTVIHVRGLIVSEYSVENSHWSSVKSLSQWLVENEIPAIGGIDTRLLTKKLREKGTMLGKIVKENEYIDLSDPMKESLVSEVSTNEPQFYSAGKKRVAVIDCGCKLSIIRSLLHHNTSVLRVPWNYEDLLSEKVDGYLISSGPGDPKMCVSTIGIVKKLLQKELPMFGICLGSQIMALAAGADTYKLKFGHRSQNQPCIKVGSKKCYITSQNHGYAVEGRLLPENWEPWFFNAI